MAMVELMATLSCHGWGAVVVGDMANRRATGLAERVKRDDEVQELESLRRSVQRGRPFGPPKWQKEIAKRLGLESAYRPTAKNWPQSGCRP
jgi:hypothetical protein